MTAERMYATQSYLDRPTSCPSSSAYVAAQLYIVTPDWGNQFGLSVFETSLNHSDITPDTKLRNFLAGLFRAVQNQEHYDSCYSLEEKDVIGVSLARFCVAKDAGSMHGVERLASVIFAEDVTPLILKTPMME